VTWSALSPAGLPATETLLKVDFVDGQHGWVLSTPDASTLSPLHLYRTVDGGASWTALMP
jgi:photosystem II stability/assembly factor-like uncharacterized protein